MELFNIYVIGHQEDMARFTSKPVIKFLTLFSFKFINFRCKWIVIVTRGTLDRLYTHTFLETYILLPTGRSINMNAKASTSRHLILWSVITFFYLIKRFLGRSWATIIYVNVLRKFKWLKYFLSAKISIQNLAKWITYRNMSILERPVCIYYLVTTWYQWQLEANKVTKYAIQIPFAAQ